MASGFSLPPPAPLELHDQNAAEKWKKFHLAWTSYSLAMELDKKAEPVQVATLLTVIGEEARDVYSTFTDWADDGDKNKIAPVLTTFAEYCQLAKMSRLSATDSIADHKKQGKRMTSTRPHFANSPRDAILIP